MRVTEYPPPPPGPHPDAPPAELLEQWCPEVVEEHQAMLAALRAASDAASRFTAAFPAESLQGNAGSDWQAALARDAAAVKRRHAPGELAEVIRSQPERYGLWVARSGYAVELVGVWNRTAHEHVSPESRRRLVEEDARLVAEVAAAAEQAVEAAAGARGDDGARLSAAWSGLSRMDAAAASWRVVRSVSNWATWQRPILVGLAWEPIRANEWPEGTSWRGVPSVTGQALALRDPELRRSLTQLAPPPPPMVSIR